MHTYQTQFSNTKFKNEIKFAVTLLDFLSFEKQVIQQLT